MEDLKKQASRFGADIRYGTVTAVDFNKTPYQLTIDGSNKIEADTIIIATGASAKYLGLPDETKYAGLGVSAFTCDGFFYRKKVVAVVGGGDTACEEAVYLAHLANKVYLIVRKDYLRASKIMQKRVMDTPNIDVLFETQTIGLFGENSLEGAHLVKAKDTDREEYMDIAIDGFFLAIGHKPNTDIFLPALHVDENGYIKTIENTTATNIPGVFAAGDVAAAIDMFGMKAYKQGKVRVINNAIDAEKYLIENEL